MWVFYLEKLRKTTKDTQEECDLIEVLLGSGGPAVRYVHSWDINLLNFMFV